MKTITQTTIGKKFDKSQGYIANLKAHIKYTMDAKLAQAMAKVYGERPIDYINPDKRLLYLKAYPRLNKEYKTAQ
jgi:hypothetical protein